MLDNLGRNLLSGILKERPRRRAFARWREGERRRKRKWNSSNR